MEPWTLIVAVAVCVLIALILWTFGIFKILKIAIISAPMMGAVHFFRTNEILGLVLAAIAIAAFWFLWLRPTYKTPDPKRD